MQDYGELHGSVMVRVRYHGATNGSIVATSLELGLSAYGRSKADALANLKQRFCYKVKCLRTVGNVTLSNWLDRSGLPWNLG